MKSYPSIDYKINGNIDVYGFDKIDGSNIRAEWSTKQGFYKFGSRYRLISENDEYFSYSAEAIELVNNKYSEPLSRLFYDHKCGRAIAFFEFYGPNSFAGNHEDEEHTVTLIDINPFRKGIIAPKVFIDLADEYNFEIPNVPFYGRVGAQVIKDVRNSQMGGITFEGIVFKGIRKGTHLSMFKIKTLAWINKVRELYASDSHKLAQLLDRTEMDLENKKSYRQRRFCPDCFTNGSLSPKCKCGAETLNMEYEAQPPRKSASKARWKKFFRTWYPELDFNSRWSNR